jgi:hypothetical protein
MPTKNWSRLALYGLEAITMQARTRALVLSPAVEVDHAPG